MTENENMIDILDKANEVIATTEHKVDEASHAASEKANELAHDAQGRYFFLLKVFLIAKVLKKKLLN
jgi:hypothetical protein